jgi:hypothetical protein
MKHDHVAPVERKAHAMKYAVFGSTGLRVSQLALGTGNFGTGWGHGADPDVSKAIFNAYAEAGGNFIDTADVTSSGSPRRFSAPGRDHGLAAIARNKPVGIGYSAHSKLGGKHEILAPPFQ